MHTREKGSLGEGIASKYLVNKGYKIIARNYLKPWGEIDIIATKDKVLHFFEVKSVTVDIERFPNGHQPEENVHRKKMRHIRRMIQTYMYETKLGPETEFRVHVLCVYLDESLRRARVKMIENIII
jgi:putative endonuclease